MTCRMTKGHYITMALRNQTWYSFDDANVKAVSEAHVMQQKAYMLFYTQRSSDDNSMKGLLRLHICYLDIRFLYLFY
jgi:hypothetical protein